MIKTLIIDDEPLARSIIKDYLAQYPEFEILQECNDGFEAVKAIAEHQPELIFLDIQMPKISGFELLEILESPPAIIFTTAFEEFALRAFEQHAIDYLLKPISKDRFDRALQKYLSNKVPQQDKTKKLINTLQENKTYIERILIKTGTTLKIIPIEKIIYLSADDDYVNVHTDNGDFLSNKTMTYFESHLDPAVFVRVHRSFIIRIDQIVRIDPYERDSHRAILRNKASINVSKSGYPKLMKALGN